MIWEECVMNKIANRTVICDVLMKKAEHDQDIVVLTSDSRGSASLAPFANAYPKQIVEVGIAEQNLVGIASGLAAVGKKPYVASPACFLTMRSIEQVKVDVAYSHTNVKLIGISAGVSYGALGMSHHSLQDIAVMSAIPNMRIVVPADRFETEKMMNLLVEDDEPCYIRVGRNPVEDIHENLDFDFEIGKGITLKEGNDGAFIATGEMVKKALDAAYLLEEEEIHVRVLNIHTIKPLDEEIIIKAALETKAIITMEEHSGVNGFGTMVSKVVAEHAPCFVKVMALPDSSLITGNSQQVFDYYGLNAVGAAEQMKKLLVKKHA